MANGALSSSHAGGFVTKHTGGVLFKGRAHLSEPEVTPRAEAVTRLAEQSELWVQLSFAP